MFCFSSRTNGGGPRVKIFLRVPGDEKSGSLPGVKIQNYNSHIQGKLARLNAAITEGLRNDQLKRENASQITAKPRIGKKENTIFALKIYDQFVNTKIQAVKDRILPPN